MVKKRALIIILLSLLLIGLFSISILGQRDITGEQTNTQGTFTLANELPEIVTDTFGVKDCDVATCAATSFDHGTVPDNGDGTDGTIDTHSVPAVGTSDVTTFEWNVVDNNGEAIGEVKTRLCLSTQSNLAGVTGLTAGATTCDVMDRIIDATSKPTSTTYRFETTYSCTSAGCAASCPVGGCLGDQTNLIDFSGTTVADADELTCVGSECTKTYYAKIIPIDEYSTNQNPGTVTASPVFDVINNVPTTLSTAATDLNLVPSNDGTDAPAPDLSAETGTETCGANGPFPNTCNLETHSQVPTITWIISDLDDGSVRNRWPQDSLSYLSYADDNGVAPYAYVDNTASGTGPTSVGTTWSTAVDTLTTVPWATESPAGVVRTAVVTEVITRDQHYAQQNFFESGAYNPTIYIADYLPDLVAPNQVVSPATGSAGLLLTEDTAFTSLQSCSTISNDGAGSLCTVEANGPDDYAGTNPYSGLEGQISFTDLDQDCVLDADHTVSLYLCETTGLTCDSVFAAGDRFDILDVDNAGVIAIDGGTGVGTVASPCIFSFDLAPGASAQTMPFFLPEALPGSDYALNLDITSQSGVERAVDEDYLYWIYGTLENLAYYDGTGPNAPVSDIQLGGGSGISQGSFNEGTDEYVVLNQGNIKKGLAWETTQVCGQSAFEAALVIAHGAGAWPEFCDDGTIVDDAVNDDQVWVLAESVTPDFIIDDDATCGGDLVTCADGTGEQVTIATVGPTTYRFPDPASTIYTDSGNVILCTDVACSGPATSRLSTYYHIYPSSVSPLQSDTYGSWITLVTV